DGGHAAAPELALEGVALSERLGQGRGHRIGHGQPSQDIVRGRSTHARWLRHRPPGYGDSPEEPDVVGGCFIIPFWPSGGKTRLFVPHLEAEVLLHLSRVTRAGVRQRWSLGHSAKHG